MTDWDPKQEQGYPLGIIPELEAACMPRAGELIVTHVNRNLRAVGLSYDRGWTTACWAPWSALHYRAGKPQTHTPAVYDLVRLWPEAA